MLRRLKLKEGDSPAEVLSELKQRLVKISDDEFTAAVINKTCSLLLYERSK